MYLSKARVQNYRNLEDLTIAFQPGFNVIVGRNNVGKSNLLRAIRHALGPKQDGSNEALYLDYDDLHCAPSCSPSANVIRVQLTYAGLSKDELAQFFELLLLDLSNPTASTAQLHFEAIWQPQKERFSVTRWGGSADGERRPVAQELLESLTLTYLHALRDAEASLVPGRSSRIATIVRAVADRKAGTHAADLVAIFQKANQELQESELIREVENRIRSNAEAFSGVDYAPPSLRPVDPAFDRVARALRIVFEGNPVSELSSNGLGYNNLLYIAAILAHLEDAPADDCPLLMIEEPEAHLHPQLTTLLGEQLAKRCASSDREKRPQAFITSHSPVLASYVRPSQISVIYQNSGGLVRACGLASAGFTDVEERSLQRMLDATKATLYFSRGLILVEGITEVLLIPQLAKLMGIDLRKKHIAVVPVHGVAFGTFQKLLSTDGFAIPTAIITDGDPPVIRGDSWKADEPERRSGQFVRCDRATSLLATFERQASVGVYCSDVTLEYDLATLDSNAETMVAVWQSLFVSGRPQTLNSDLLAAAGGAADDRALCVWRGICRADTTATKAEFAHRLAEVLGTDPAPLFTVPKYIQDGIRRVADAIAADQG